MSCEKQLKFVWDFMKLNRRIQCSGRAQYGQIRGRPRYEQNYRTDYRRGNFRGNERMYKKFNDRIVEGNIEEIIEMTTIIAKEVGVGLKKDNFQRVII